MAKQMVQLYRDSGLRAQLAARAKEEYAPIRWDIMKQRYLRMIEGLTGPSHRTPEGSRIPEETNRQDTPHVETTARLAQ
jgi:hypothetical protein